MRVGEGQMKATVAAAARCQDALRIGLTPTGMPGSTLTADVATDHAYWGKLVRELGVKVE